MHKKAQKSTVLEIIYSYQKIDSQEMDTIMLSHIVSKHALSSEMDPLLQVLFLYIDQFALPEARYVTGDHPFRKNHKMFLVKNLFFHCVSMPVGGHTEALRLLPTNWWTSRGSPSFYVFTCRKVGSRTRFFRF